MPHIRTEKQPVTQITVVESEPGKQAEALYDSFANDIFRTVGRISDRATIHV